MEVTQIRILQFAPMLLQTEEAAGFRTLQFAPTCLQPNKGVRIIRIFQFAPGLPLFKTTCTPQYTPAKCSKMGHYRHH